MKSGTEMSNKNKKHGYKAYDAGLDFVGYEICKDYFDKQEQRFQNHIAQTSLFVGLKDDIEKEKLEVSCHSEDWIN